MSRAMGRSEGARTRSIGRQGSRSTRPVSGPPHPDVRAVPSPEGDVIASEKSVRGWEAAYRQYGRAWEMTARCGKDDPVAAREMATASWAVAAAWRQIANATQLPWWTLVALESAASAFEAQAREYETGEASEGS